jgi:sugar phosphate isomerase/epimerase
MDLRIGVSGLGVLHTDASVPDIGTKFAMIKDSGVFDYIDRTPPRADLEDHLRASAKYGIPTFAGGFYYMVGRDEKLLEDNIRIGKECGSEVHNVQIFTNDAAGRPLSDDDIVDVYMKTAELGDKIGVLPCFENHINMWSEHPGRVQRVAEKVNEKGGKFSMTIDHSHVVMKMDNPVEQEVQQLDKDVQVGNLTLDPNKSGNVAKRWIDANYVVIAHARPAVPNNPINVWAKHPNGRFGRGVQYPWIKPAPGEWHSDWDERKLDPWKQTICDLLTYHAHHPESRMRCLTLEMIPPPDYGAGAKYSIFNNNVACAQWIRALWKDIVKRQQEGLREVATALA